MVVNLSSCSKLLSGMIPVITIGLSNYEMIARVT
jgi:hypothetical protein